MGATFIGLGSLTFWHVVMVLWSLPITALAVGEIAFRILAKHPPSHTNRWLMVLWGSIIINAFVFFQAIDLLRNVAAQADLEVFLFILLVSAPLALLCLLILTLRRKVAPLSKLFPILCGLNLGAPLLFWALLSIAKHG